MNSVQKYKGETLLDVVVREYGTAGALAAVMAANNLAVDDTTACMVNLPEFEPEKPQPVATPVKKELKQIVLVEKRQSLIDLSIQHYGTAETLANLFAEFGKMQIDYGDQLSMPVIEVQDKQKLSFFRNRRKVATQTPDVAVGSDQAIIAQGNFLILTKSGSFIKFK